MTVITIQLSIIITYTKIAQMFVLGKHVQDILFNFAINTVRACVRACVCVCVGGNMCMTYCLILRSTLCVCVCVCVRACVRACVRCELGLYNLLLRYAYVISLIQLVQVQ